MLRRFVHIFLLLGFIHSCYVFAQLDCQLTELIRYYCDRQVVLAVPDLPDFPMSNEDWETILYENDVYASIIQRLAISPANIKLGVAVYGQVRSAFLGYIENRSDMCYAKEKATFEGPMTLPSAVQYIIKTYIVHNTSLVLMTNSSQEDVNEAGGLLKSYIDRGVVENFNAVVIDFGGSSFHNWPKHTNVYRERLYDANKTADYVGNLICGYRDYDDYNTTTTPASREYSVTGTDVIDYSRTVSQSHGPFTNATPTIEIAPTTTESATAKSTEPSLPVADIENTGCKCNLRTVWLDIFLLMEASLSMTENGITSATDYVVSALTKLTIGQAEQFQTRLGVIRYASSVELIADLNTYTSKADLFDLNISVLNETGTNIEGAIRLATSEFSSSSHRRAARPVLIIVGSSYKDGGFNDPTQIAHEFRADGGIIITLEYVQEHGLAVPMLRTLASPNFSLTNQKTDGTELHANELRQLLCEANCFCKKNWMPYKTTKWDSPNGGCYFPVAIPSIQLLANRTCFRRNDAMLVLDEDIKKDAFLMTAFPPKTKFWLGLRYDGNQWTWPGGYSAGFTKWAPGHPDSRAGECVYMEYNGMKSAWFSDDCDNDHNYICQATPCDSTKYCAAG